MAGKYPRAADMIEDKAQQVFTPRPPEPPAQPPATTPPKPVPQITWHEQFGALPRNSNAGVT